MSCAVCNDTGRTAGSDYLDCGRCDVAEKRAELEAWALKNKIACRCPDALWAIYQKGAAEGQPAT